MDNLDLSLDTRYTDIQSMSDETTVNGAGSILSSSYRFRPIATEHILGDLNALREGNIEQYGKQSLWDTYSPYERAMDEEPLSIKQKLRGTLSLNWNIIKELTYHTDLTLSRDWNQDKNGLELFPIIILMMPQMKSYGLVLLIIKSR